MQTKSLLGPGGSPSFANVTIQAGGTLDLYNTADQTTNYERLRADWSGNVARIYTDTAGTGAWRNLTIGLAVAGNPLITLSRTGQGVTVTGVLTTTGNSQLIVNGGMFTSSGTVYGLNVSPTITQSGTAGYTALDVNPTESATGSGTKLLQRWAVGGTTAAQMTNNGYLYVNNLSLSGSYGLSASFGGAADVNLYRDAADTPALRRGANAQTFRGYETYTDASNYSRWYQTFSGGFAYYGTQAAGTGTRRPLIVQHHQTTVAALPAAATVGAGSRCHVSDALGPVFGAAVAGGGAVSVPVYSDGANWLVG